MEKNIYCHNLTVNFSDVGEKNELTNKGMLRLLQEIAGIHSGLLGYGVNDIPKTCLAWIILNWKLKMFSRPKTNTMLNIKTWTRSENPLFSYRDFEVVDENNNLVALASSKWILFDTNRKTISKITKDIKEKYVCIEKFAFEEKINEKLLEPSDSKFIMNYTVQRRDIDTNHHVNNLNYLDFANEVLPENIYFNIEFSNVEIMYKREAKLGDIISLFYSHSGENEYTITIKDEKQKNIHTIIKLYN